MNGYSRQCVLLLQSGKSKIDYWTMFTLIARRLSKESQALGWNNKLVTFRISGTAAKCVLEVLYDSHVGFNFKYYASRAIVYKSNLAPYFSDRIGGKK